MADEFIVGIDGGASKTRAAVLSGSGAVLAVATVQSASAYHREPEEAAGVVVAAAQEALRQADLRPPVRALGAGLAGADDPAVRARLVAVLRASGLAPHVHVDHDAAAALAGGLCLAPGVVIIAGTGSVAFGVDRDGNRARCGGWGPLLDDEGSGYAIGRAVLRAAMRAHDGRGPATALADAVRARFALRSLDALKQAVRGVGIDEVAAVAPLAFAAARAGDAAARRILRRAGRDLAMMIGAVARALGWAASAFPLIAVGGVFEAGDLIIAPMTEALRAAGIAAALRPAALSPEIGAALLAARASGLDATALAARLTARRRGDLDAPE
ncbi:MAG: BadF/BadG/BcrA/BcrD ATPase family protein [Armatimonadota bacterium]|nr:BadF/BadG/BcrA/BcrD ATPase family protein [Armatimonadota bacterium]